MALARMGLQKRRVRTTALIAAASGFTATVHVARESGEYVDEPPHSAGDEWRSAMDCSEALIPGSS